jgi:hypothetical protein
VTVLRLSDGSQLARYHLRTEYDEEAGATGAVLSANGVRWFSCIRDTLVVRDARTGGVEDRYPDRCALDTQYDPRGEPIGVPSPSPDGRFTTLLSEADAPCLVRVRDGSILRLERGLRGVDVRRFFEAG